MSTPRHFTKINPAATLQCMTRVYLDTAGAAPVTPRATRAFLNALTRYGNPSSAHTEGREAKTILDTARSALARMAGVKKEYVLFTSGATEANALAIEGTIRMLLKKGHTPSSLRLMYHPGAHASVAHLMERLSKEGIAVAPLPLQKGAIDTDALTPLPEPTLVSIEAISSETGMRHELRKLRAALPTSTLLHVDGSQVPLVESFERERLGADLLTLDAQKVGGVRGIGALILSPRVSLAPLIEGGGQERGLRSGTEAPALAAAFVAALEETKKNHEAFRKQSISLREKLIARITKAIPDTHVLGGEGVSHILAVAFPGRDTDYLQALLDAKGYAVGTRSACETDSSEGSRMAYAETGDRVLAASTLRVSWGPRTKERDLLRFADALISAIRFLDQNKVK
jgi:cysteine desulfurase